MTQKKPSKKIVKTISTRSSAATIAKTNSAQHESEPMLFGQKNYLILLGGFLLIIVGMLLMMGGHMPSRDVWDDNIIYSFRRTVLAPIIILAGLVVGGYSIFKK